MNTSIIVTYIDSHGQRQSVLSDIPRSMLDNQDYVKSVIDYMYRDLFNKDYKATIQ